VSAEHELTAINRGTYERQENYDTEQRGLRLERSIWQCSNRHDEHDCEQRNGYGHDRATVATRLANSYLLNLVQQRLRQGLVRREAHHASTERKAVEVVEKSGITD
jgi:hypothetical protein